MREYTRKHPKKSPGEMGFSSGLWSQDVKKHPKGYSPKEIAQYKAGWWDGNHEATLRRQEASAGMPRTVKIRERNGKDVLYTEAAARRRAARMGGGDDK